MAWENARVIMKWDNHENSGKNPELLTKNDEDWTITKN